MSLKSIKQAVTAGQLKQGLQALQSVAEQLNDNDLENTVILLLSRYHGNEQQNNIGSLTQDQYAREQNKLRHALLSTIDDVRIPPGVEINLPEMDSPGEQPPISPVSPPAVPAEEEQQTRILFLSANPSDTGKLALRKEHSRVMSEISSAENNGKFVVRDKWATTPGELSRSIIREKPHIVHFSGHGLDDIGESESNSVRAGRPAAEAAPSRPQAGIVLMDEDGSGSHAVGTDYLNNLFESMINDMGIPIRTVVFNACYAEEQAKTISRHVEYVIGTTSAVKDRAAQAFAAGFYFALVGGMDIVRACNMGIIDAMAFGEPRDRFVLYHKGERVDN